VCMCACVHVCMCACVHMCMCAYVHVCMCAHAHIAAWQDTNAPREPTKTDKPLCAPSGALRVTIYRDNGDVAYSDQLPPPEDVFSRGAVFFDASRSAEGVRGGGEVRGRYVRVMLVGRGALGLREVKVEGPACWDCQVWCLFSLLLVPVIARSGACLRSLHHAQGDFEVACMHAYTHRQRQ